MKKFTEKQIKEGFKLWKDDYRKHPEQYYSCYTTFSENTETVASERARVLVKFITGIDK